MVGGEGWGQRKQILTNEKNNLYLFCHYILNDSKKMLHLNKIFYTSLNFVRYRTKHEICSSGPYNPFSLAVLITCPRFLSPQV